ncbi:hypothetical protein ACIO93_01415 [Streptomyces sp. NPDC087903]|uniref:hypothetical protein n=1 Tax=Streptomyces sp. NPDC087903 TaxID=3365819 RepID=UPI0037F34199
MRDPARQAEQQALDDYIRTTAGQGAESGNETERLAKLSDVRSGGDITDEEFQRAEERFALTAVVSGLAAGSPPPLG